MNEQAIDGRRSQRRMQRCVKHVHAARTGLDCPREMMHGCVDVHAPIACSARPIQGPNVKMRCCLGQFREGPAAAVRHRDTGAFQPQRHAAVPPTTPTPRRAVDNAPTAPQASPPFEERTENVGRQRSTCRAGRKHHHADEVLHVELRLPLYRAETFAQTLSTPRSNAAPPSHCAPPARPSEPSLVRSRVDNGRGSADYAASPKDASQTSTGRICASCVPKCHTNTQYVTSPMSSPFSTEL